MGRIGKLDEKEDCNRIGGSSLLCSDVRFNG